MRKPRKSRRLVTSRHIWTIREIMYLREHAGKTPLNEMAAVLRLSAHQVACQIYWDRRFRLGGESKVWCLN